MRQAIWLLLYMNEVICEPVAALDFSMSRVIKLLHKCTINVNKCTLSMMRQRQTIFIRVFPLLYWLPLIIIHASGCFRLSSSLHIVISHSNEETKTNFISKTSRLNRIQLFLFLPYILTQFPYVPHKHNNTTNLKYLF